MKANKLLEEAAAALAPSPAQGTAMNVDADTSAVSLMPEMSAPVEVITHQIQPEIKSAPPVAGPSRLYVAVDAADSPPGRSKDDSPAIVHQVKQVGAHLQVVLFIADDTHPLADFPIPYSDNAQQYGPKTRGSHRRRRVRERRESCQKRRRCH